MSKKVAQSLLATASGEIVDQLLDRSAKVSSVLIEGVLDQWGYDLFSRKPAPAILENGVLQPTDLDLACFLSALADRHAVIALPRYTARRPKTVKEGEWVTSSQNRHGKVLGLTANKDVFSFSIRIQDENVVTQGTGDDGEGEKTGAPRNFMLTDLSGVWYGGWDRIEFLPSRKENAFLENRELWTGNTVVFRHFVHPNRWQSFYGQHYVLLKILIDRMEGECTHLRSWMMAHRELAPPVTGERVERPAVERAAGKPIKVETLEAWVDAPFHGEWPALPEDQVVYTDVAERVRLWTYTLLPRLRFAARTVELAFYNAGGASKGFPAWIQGARWEYGWKVKGTRTAWNRFVICQRKVGEQGIALLYRLHEKTERVAE